jgi:hypothetical protein
MLNDKCELGWIAQPNVNIIAKSIKNNELNGK